MASETIKSKGDLSKGSLNCRNLPGHGTCSCADRDNVRVRSPESFAWQGRLLSRDGGTRTWKRLVQS